jgi:MoxR-like ATPase
MEQTGVAEIAERFRALSDAIAQVVVGQQETVRLCFLTLLCSGHSLVEGVPGVAKTLLVRTLAAALDVRFGRVQFTPDLMPSDILGTSILETASGEVRFRPGPIFTDLLLADEINRASAKTQAAPVEQEGTYPLPEAELDRFLFKIVVDYPSEDEERGILELHHAAGSDATLPAPVLRAENLEAIREAVRGVIVREEILGYVAALVRATRSDLNYALGASPRAGLMLLRAAKANAAVEGRDYALPEDVQAMLLPALRHRIQLDPAAEVEGLTPDEALGRTLRAVAVPR